MVGGNTAELIEDYVGSIDAMIADIDTATDFVHVEFFILVHDHTTAPFFDALARAWSRGVTVRVLSDHVAQYFYPRPQGDPCGVGGDGGGVLPDAAHQVRRATTSGRTCATTASWSWSTVGSGSPARRT